MADDYLLGSFTGELRFDLPDAEMKKLDAMQDVIEEAKKLTGGQNLGLKSLEVIRQVGDTQSKFKFEIPKAEENKLTGFIKQVPILKDFYKSFAAGGAAGIGTAAAVLGAVGVLFLSGSGFKQTLGALWDLLGMVSDLIFVALWPVIKPLLDSFVEFGRWLADHSHGPGGLLGAFFDPNLWAGAVGILVDGLLKSVDALAQLGIGILNGFMDGMENDPRVSDIWTRVGQDLGKALFDVGTLGVMLVDVFVKVFTDPKVIDAFVEIGGKIAEGFVRGVTVGPMESRMQQSSQGMTPGMSDWDMAKQGLSNMWNGGFWSG